MMETIVRMMIILKVMRDVIAVQWPNESRELRDSETIIWKRKKRRRKKLTIMTIIVMMIMNIENLNRVEFYMKNMNMNMIMVVRCTITTDISETV